MISRLQQYWQSALFRSLLLHGVILSFLLINLHLPARMLGEDKASQQADKVVNAVTVDERVVAQEMKRIKKEQQDKQHAEQQRKLRLKNLRTAAIKAKKARAEELKRLKSVQAKRKLAEKKNVLKRKKRRLSI